MADELFESDVFTLTDEEGNEDDYELIGTVEVDDVTYYALIPCTDDDKEATEYIVLRGEKDENGEDVLVSIDDDEEFDRNLPTSITMRTPTRTTKNKNDSLRCL